MNIKIYVKTINIIKNYIKVSKIVYFITIFKKVYSTVAKFFLFFKFFIFINNSIFYNSLVNKGYSINYMFQILMRIGY